MSGEINWDAWDITRSIVVNLISVIVTVGLGAHLLISPRDPEDKAGKITGVNPLDDNDFNASQCPSYFR